MVVSTIKIQSSQPIMPETLADDIISRKPENLAVCTNPSHELYLKSEPIPKPDHGQCLVHVRATGICGSDVHFWKKGHIGDMVVVGENGLGHESAGIVVEVGEGVSRFKKGKSTRLLPVVDPHEADFLF